MPVDISHFNSLGKHRNQASSWQMQSLRQAPFQHSEAFWKPSKMKSTNLLCWLVAWPSGIHPILCPSDLLAHQPFAPKNRTEPRSYATSTILSPWLVLLLLNAAGKADVQRRAADALEVITHDSIFKDQPKAILTNMARNCSMDGFESQTRILICKNWLQSWKSAGEWTHNNLCKLTDQGGGGYFAKKCHKKPLKKPEFCQRENFAYSKNLAILQKTHSFIALSISTALWSVRISHILP